MGEVHKIREIERDVEFVTAYVSNGGNARQAAIACGVSEGSASTVGHRLKTRLAKEIQTELRDTLNDIAPEAINRMRELSETAGSEQVRLSANKDLLDRAGYKPVDKAHITTTGSSLEEEDDTTLHERLDGWHKDHGTKLVPLNAIVINRTHPDYEHYMATESGLAEFVPHGRGIRGNYPTNWHSAIETPHYAFPLSESEQGEYLSQHVDHIGGTKPMRKEAS